MDPNTIRGLINGLLYVIQFAPDLCDTERIDFVAEGIRNQTMFIHSAAEYCEAITAVLNDGHLPAQTLPIPMKHNEAEILGWLGRLAQRLSDDPPNAASGRQLT